MWQTERVGRTDIPIANEHLLRTEAANKIKHTCRPMQYCKNTKKLHNIQNYNTALRCQQRPSRHSVWPGQQTRPDSEYYTCLRLTNFHDDKFLRVPWVKHCCDTLTFCRIRRWSTLCCVLSLTTFRSRRPSLWSHLSTCRRLLLYADEHNDKKSHSAVHCH